MKKVALITLFIISLIGVGAAYLFPSSPPSQLIKAQSQQDTSIDPVSYTHLTLPTSV